MFSFNVVMRDLDISPWCITLENFSGNLHHTSNLEQVSKIIFQKVNSLLTSMEECV